MYSYFCCKEVLNTHYVVNYVVDGICIELILNMILICAYLSRMMIWKMLYIFVSI
jgi:hypothetical protein